MEDRESVRLFYPNDAPEQGRIRFAQVQSNTMEDLWSRAMFNLRATTRRAVVDSWYEPIALLNSAGDRVHLGVPDSQFLSYIRDHHLERIQASIEAVADGPVQIELTVQGEGAHAAPCGKLPSTSRQGALPINDRPAPPPHRSDYLIDFLNFESFIVGQPNELAHGAALSVSEAPSTTFNPLFVYGGVGIGKTHLLHAIGLALRMRQPEFRILYVPSASFIDDTIAAMRSSSTSARARVRDRYRDVDVLLIADIQFMQRKEKTQEEFFHTFNALHQAGKQIVLTSDRFPTDLKGFQDRLRSRFEWGLVAEIGAPDREMRIAILLRKAQAAGMVVPLDVVHYIADHLRNNVRELEGALNKLLAHSRISHRRIDMALARDVLGPIIELPSRNLTIDAIQKATSRHFALRITDLKGGKRTRGVVVPRMLAMYLVRKHTDASYPEIGRAFGGRDHSTAINACRRIGWQLKTDDRLAASLQSIEQALGR